MPFDRPHGPAVFQSRFANWSCSFELAPAPSFVIAVFLSESKPALAVSSVRSTLKLMHSTA